MSILAADIVTTNVRLDRDVYLRMKRIAAESSRSLSDVLREASAEYVARREGAVPPGAVRNDPFLRFLEEVDREGGVGATDTAAAHDRYLYGGEHAGGAVPRPPRDPSGSDRP